MKFKNHKNILCTVEVCLKEKKCVIYIAVSFSQASVAVDADRSVNYNIRLRFAGYKLTLNNLAVNEKQSMIIMTIFLYILQWLTV